MELFSIRIQRTFQLVSTMLVSMFPTKTRKNPRKFFVVFRKCHILGAEIEGQRQGNNRPPLTGYFKINLLFNLKL